MSIGTKTAQLKVNANVASPSISSPGTQPYPATKNYNSCSASTSSVSSPFSKPQVSTSLSVATFPPSGSAAALANSSTASLVTTCFSTQVPIGPSENAVQSLGSGLHISPAKFIPTLTSPPAAAPSFSKPQIPSGPIAMFGQLTNGIMSQNRDIKRKREEEDEKKYVDTGNIMVPNTVSSSLLSARESFVDGYTFALQECLKFVPKRRKTQCIIEMLQVIQKYELHEE